MIVLMHERCQSVWFLRVNQLRDLLIVKILFNIFLANSNLSHIDATKQAKAEKRAKRAKKDKNAPKKP